MINCAHPTHFERRARGRRAAGRERIRGLRANASRMSHAELDEATELDAGDPEELGARVRASCAAAAAAQRARRLLRHRPPPRRPDRGGLRAALPRWRVTQVGSPDARAGSAAAFSPDAAASDDIVARRLRAQRLTGAGFARPEDVVGWLGAVQAQDYGPAKWSLGARVDGATDAQVEHAFATGAILRTHVLRPTWHFVLPADIRWLLTATAPRIRARDARRYVQLGLDDDTLRRSAGVLASALRGGNQLTRREVGGRSDRRRDRCRGPAAAIPADGRRARRPHLQRSAARQAAHVHAARGAGAGRARPAARRGAGGAGAPVLHRSRAGDGQGLRRLGDADPGRGARRDRGGGAGAAGRGSGRSALLGACDRAGERGRAPLDAAVSAGPPRPGLRRDRHGLHRDQVAAGPARLAVGAGDSAGLPARRPVGRRGRRVLAPEPRRGIV